MNKNHVKDVMFSNQIENIIQSEPNILTKSNIRNIHSNQTKHKYEPARVKSEPSFLTESNTNKTHVNISVYNFMEILY